MQNRYVADVGDFGKFELLRALVGVVDSDDGPRLSVGVVWYRPSKERALPVTAENAATSTAAAGNASKNAIPSCSVISRKSLTPTETSTR